MNKKGKTLKEDFIEAVQSFKKKDFKNAEIVCYKILSIDPNHFDSISLLATLAAINGNFDKAIELLGKAIKIQPKNITTIHNLGTAYKELGNLKEAMNYYKNKAFNKHVSFLSKNKCIINEKIFSDEAQEVVFKSFSDILSLVAGKYYPPRSKKIMSLIHRLKKTEYSKSTLGGCVIEKKDGFFLVYKEERASVSTYQPSK